MDTELLRTFLEINKTRHFGRAASNLYLTQSAVSARMRLLEQTIGTPLLTRSRNDIQLTPAGRKLLPHAENIVERWTQAQQEVALHEEEKASLNLGARLTIAEMVFPNWTLHLWKNLPDVALNVESLPDAVLATRLAERTIDLAVTYGPSANPDFKDVELGKLTLHLMSTDSTQSVEDALGANYVHLEWGTWFNFAQAKAFPDRIPGGLRTGSLHLVLELLAQQDGACFLPTDIVEATRRDQMKLFPVAGAPTLEHEVFASYASDSPQRGLIEEVLHALRESDLIG